MKAKETFTFPTNYLSKRFDDKINLSKGMKFCSNNFAVFFNFAVVTAEYKKTSKFHPLDFSELFQTKNKICNLKNQ